MPKCSKDCKKQSCIFFRKTEVPAVVQDDSITPPQNGDFCNMLVVYEATGNAYLFASDGIPTLLSVSDYTRLKNLPSINGVTIIGNLTLAEIGVTDLVEEEAEEREAYDANLQEQIDAIVASSDVVDIVGTYEELEEYDTSHLTDNDVIKVLSDETEGGATTYYRWLNNSWQYIGAEGPYYTTAQVDALLDEKVDLTALTDYYTKTETDTLLANKADLSDLVGKQDKLIAGANITIDQATNVISATQPSLDNYYTKQETYSQSEVNGLISGVEAQIPTKTSDLTNDSGFLTSIPIASDSVLGGVKVGSGLSIDQTGVLSATGPAITVDSVLSTTSTNPVENRVITNALDNKANISDIPVVPTNVSAFYNDAGYVTSSTIAQNYYNKTETYTQNQVDGLISGVTAQIPSKTSDLTNDGSDGTSTYVELDELAAVATSGSYNDLTNKPTIPEEMVVLSYGNSTWNDFITAYNDNRVVYCRASSQANPASGTQGRMAFMAYVDDANTPTEVEFQYVRSVDTKTVSQPVDQVFVYRLTSANGGTWTVASRDMAPKLAQGTNTTVSYSNGTYTISATQPTVNDATLTIQKNGTSAGTFTANASVDKTINITVPTTAADVHALPDTTKYGSSLTMSIDNTTYVVTATLKDQDGNTLGSAQTIDLPLESVVVNGSYDSTNKKIVLTLQNGTTIDIPVADLISGLQAEITPQNMLDADLVDDSTSTHKFTTASDISKLAGIQAGAEVNVQSDWNQTNSSADDFIKNKPSIPAAQVNSDWNAVSGVAQILNKPTIPTATSQLINDSGFITGYTETDPIFTASPAHSITNADITAWNNKSDFSGDYDDLTNKPTIPTKTSDLTNDGSDGTAAYLETDETAYRTTSIPYGQCDSTSTSTAFTATVPGITELRDGVCMLLKNGVVTSESGFTININGLGAKPAYNNMAAATRDTTLFNINYTMLFVYDSTRVSGGCWICYRGYYSDANSIGYRIRTNSSTLLAKEKGYRYRLWLTSADGQNYVPINKSTATNNTTARTLNTTPIDPFGTIVYNSTNGTVNANAELPTGTQWTQYAIDLRYSLCPITLTFPDPVYLQCTPQSTGGAVMDAVVQTLPTTDDGKIYIYLGNAYSATSVELKQNHPVYYFKDGAIREWTNAAAGIASVAWGDITGTLSSQTDLNTALGAKANSADLATVATSGSYNDLTNKPTIPTVNNATLTIQRNSTNVATFTANASSNVTANISVPTATSDLTNDSGFITSITKITNAEIDAVMGVA